MAEPVFKPRSSGDSIYLLCYDDVVSVTTAFWPSAPVGPSISISNSWNNKAGYYLFLGEAISNPSVFVSQLQQYLKDPANRTVLFLWIKNPNSSIDQWSIDTLKVDQQSTRGQNTFTFANYLLSVAGNCAITLQNNGDMYSFRLLSSQPSFYFETNRGGNRYALPDVSIVLSYDAPTVGCWMFGIIVNSSDPLKPNADTLDIGMRYYVDIPEYEGYLRSLRFPLFEPVTQNVSLNVCLDPVNHLSIAKTWFSLAGTSTLNTYYRSNLGQKVQLTAQAEARLVFNPLPSVKWPASADSYTLAPEGKFTVVLPPSGDPGGPKARLMCGISGVEYLGLPVENGCTLHFFSGNNAYAPALQQPGSMRRGGGDQGLTSAATTSWVYVTPPDGGEKVIYYAQPEDSVLYQGDRSGALAQYLDYLETEANTLLPAAGIFNSASESVATAFPMVPFTGIDPSAIALLRALEQQVLSPSRRDLIYRLSEPPPGPGTGDVYGATPQGLVVTLDQPKRYWKALTLLHSENQSDTGTAAQTFQLTNITGKFKAALQTNQLMLIANAADVFQQSASVNYQITYQSLVDLKELGQVPDAVIAKLTAFPGMTGKLYPGKETYTNDLKARLTAQEYQENEDKLLMYGAFAFISIGTKEFYELSGKDIDAMSGYQAIPSAAIAALRSSGIPGTRYQNQNDYETALKQVITTQYDACAPALIAFGKVISDGWHFNVSPYVWKDHHTLMIFKYAGKSLEDLIADTSTWVWPEAATGKTADGGSGSIENTQDYLNAWVSRVKDKAKTEPDFENINKKITDPWWNGILFLNVEVPLNSLPPQLEGLAAGIDPAKFFGHHLGINITPVHNDNGVLEPSDTSVFGLIYYDDPEDQFNEGDPYGFKVLSLKILFENSVIANFFSQVELMITQLFSEGVTLLNAARGNNLILNGVYQKHDGADAYVFSGNGNNIFESASYVLDQVLITQVQFITVVPPDGFNPGETVQTKFILSGKLMFIRLPNFDVFSFGKETDDADTVDGLYFNNLTIHMDFPQDHPDQKTFAFDAGILGLDLSMSKAREFSFFNHFPLRLQGLVQSKGDNSPGDQGYISTNSPLQQGKLEGTWYGFNFTLDLGTLGALSGDIGFVITVFAGWAPSADDYNVYIGIKLPGSKSASAAIPIEGVLKLIFKKLEITAAPVPANPNTGLPASIAYMLKFKNIALSLLGFNFPPGQFDMYIFGNPDSDKSAVGWYAAYVNDEKE